VGVDEAHVLAHVRVDHAHIGLVDELDDEHGSLSFDTFAARTDLAENVPV
jgi:hypothetical protein